MLVDYVRVYQKTGGGTPAPQGFTIDFENAPETYDFGVDGGFARGDAVEVAVEDHGRAEVIGKGITQYGARDLGQLCGRQSHEIEAVLGYTHTPHVIRRDDLVLIDGPA